MSLWSSLLAWGNVPFTIALGVAVLFATLQMSGLLGLLAGDADGDGDADADVDADVDAHVEVDAHADVDADADADADADGDADAEHGGFGRAVLASVGAGRVPLIVLFETFTLSFAFTGIAINTFSLARLGGVPPVSLAWTLPIAILAGYLATRFLGSWLAGILADKAQEATSRAELVGLAGVVISSRVSKEFGEVRLRDKTGHVVRVVCRAHGADIAEGREVVVVNEDEADGRLIVAPFDTREP